MTLLAQTIKGRERFEGILQAATAPLVLFQRVVTQSKWYSIDVSVALSAGNTTVSGGLYQAAGFYLGGLNQGVDVSALTTKLNLNNISQTYVALVVNYGGVRGIPLVLFPHATENLQYVADVLIYSGP